MNEQMYSVERPGSVAYLIEGLRVIKAFRMILWTYQWKWRIGYFGEEDDNAIFNL